MCLSAALSITFCIAAVEKLFGRFQMDNALEIQQAVLQAWYNMTVEQYLDVVTELLLEIGSLPVMDVLSSGTGSSSQPLAQGSSAAFDQVSSSQIADLTPDPLAESALRIPLTEQGDHNQLDQQQQPAALARYKDSLRLKLRQAPQVHTDRWHTGKAPETYSKYHLRFDPLATPAEKKAQRRITATSIHRMIARDQVTVHPKVDNLPLAFAWMAALLTFVDTARFSLAQQGAPLQLSSSVPDRMFQFLTGKNRAPQAQPAPASGMVMCQVVFMVSVT